MNIQNVRIKKLDDKDLLIFQNLIHLFNLVFEVEDSIANESNLQNLLNKKEFVVMVAIYEDIAIGGLTAYEMPMYSSNCSELYIYDLAVDSKFQRLGIGKLLISELEKYCQSNNIKTMFVEANSEDKNAIDFYNSVNGNAEQVVHFNFDI